jgi:type II secretory pathway pseudopilin PulG
MACPITTGSAIDGRPAPQAMAVRRSAGFTYIGLLVTIVIIGVMLAFVGQVWSTEAQREREAELLYRGDTIRKAIGAYLLGLGGTGQYPRELQDMIQDQRVPQIKRELRRVYEDPMTGMADWTLIRGPDGGIMGVASSSNGKPLKVRGFDAVDETFKDATCYCDWQFLYIPPRHNYYRAPAVGPGTPGTPGTPSPAPTPAPGPGTGPPPGVLRPPR